MLNQNIYNNSKKICIALCAICGLLLGGCTGGEISPTPEAVQTPAPTEDVSGMSGTEAEEISQRYFSSHTKADNSRLYIAEDGSWCMQVPEDAHCADMAEGIVRISFVRDGEMADIYVHAVGNENAPSDVYTTAEEIVEKHAQYGLNFVGEVTDLEQLYDGEENIGCQYIQRVETVTEPYGAVYRDYYNTPYSIQASLVDLEEDTIAEMEGWLDTFAFGEF